MSLEVFDDGAQVEFAGREVAFGHKGLEHRVNVAVVKHVDKGLFVGFMNDRVAVPELAAAVGFDGVVFRAAREHPTNLVAVNAFTAQKGSRPGVARILPTGKPDALSFQIFEGL